MVEAAQEERGGNTLSRSSAKTVELWMRLSDTARWHDLIGLPALAAVARHDLIGSSALAGVAWKDLIATAHVTATRVIVTTTHSSSLFTCAGKEFANGNSLLFLTIHHANWPTRATLASKSFRTASRAPVGSIKTARSTPASR